MICYFTEVSNDRIMRSAPGGQSGSGRVLEVYCHPSGRSNGLVFDLQGRLVPCEGGSRRVTRTELDGTVAVLAGSFQGKPFNSPNDIDVGGRGRLYEQISIRCACILAGSTRSLQIMVFDRWPSKSRYEPGVDTSDAD